jgi:hypothetical protein
VTGKLPPSSYLECLKFVTNHKQMVSDFLQRPIPRVHNDQIVMKSPVKKSQFLRVQVIVKEWQAYNPTHYTRLNLVCLLTARYTSIDRNCMPSFGILLSDDISWENHVILMHSIEPKYLCQVNIVAFKLIMSLWLMMRCLQDCIRNILMWVSTYYPFTTNIGIDDI